MGAETKAGIQGTIDSGPLARPEEIAALVITYFPDKDLPKRLDRLIEQVGRICVVDNGSDEQSLSVLEPYLQDKRVSLRRNQANLGIAAALNQGIEELSAEGYPWVLTLDQDSSLTPNFVEQLCAKLERDPAPEKVAIVGASRHDPLAPGAVHRWVRPKRGLPFYELVECSKLTHEGTSTAITSGSLTNVKAFREIGGFRGDMFIDMVDMEYCLRARRFGYRTIVSCSAELIHRVGDTRTVWLMGLRFSPTHHAPIRRYYLFRNSLAVMKDHGRVFPYWLAYNSMALVQILVGIVLLEPRKAAQLRACALGLWDGLRGHTGPARQRF